MKTTLVINPIAVTQRLSELGWTLKEIREVVSASVRARRGCTENHPPTSAGYYGWSEAVAAIRKLGSLKGFDRNDDEFFYSTFDKKNGTRFGVCNTGDGTGLEHGIAQNNNKRGPGTVQIVAMNQAMFDFGDPSTNVIQMSKRGIAYWYLCIYCAGDEVRAELSSPSACENGFFTQFHERIMINLEENGDNPTKVRRDDSGGGGSEFDITVVRKQA